MPQDNSIFQIPSASVTLAYAMLRRIRNAKRATDEAAVKAEIKKKAAATGRSISDEEFEAAFEYLHDSGYLVTNDRALNILASDNNARELFEHRHPEPRLKQKLYISRKGEQALADDRNAHSEKLPRRFDAEKSQFREIHSLKDQLQSGGYVEPVDFPQHGYEYYKLTGKGREAIQYTNSPEKTEAVRALQAMAKLPGNEPLQALLDRLIIMESGTQPGYRAAEIIRTKDIGGSPSRRG